MTKDVLFMHLTEKLRFGISRNPNAHKPLQVQAYDWETAQLLDMEQIDLLLSFCLLAKRYRKQRTYRHKTVTSLPTHVRLGYDTKWRMGQLARALMGNREIIED